MTFSIKCSTYMSIKFGQRCSFGKSYFNFSDNQNFSYFPMILLNKGNWWYKIVINNNWDDQVDLYMETTLIFHNDKWFELNYLQVKCKVQSLALVLIQIK